MNSNEEGAPYNVLKLVLGFGEGKSVVGRCYHVGRGYPESRVSLVLLDARY